MSSDDQERRDLEDLLVQGQEVMSGSLFHTSLRLIWTTGEGPLTSGSTRSCAVEHNRGRGLRCLPVTLNNNDVGKLSKSNILAFNETLKRWTDCFGLGLGLGLGLGFREGLQQQDGVTHRGNVRYLYFNDPRVSKRGIDGGKSHRGKSNNLMHSCKQPKPTGAGTRCTRI